MATKFQNPELMYLNFENMLKWSKSKLNFDGNFEPMNPEITKVYNEYGFDVQKIRHCKTIDFKGQLQLMEPEGTQDYIDDVDTIVDLLVVSRGNRKCVVGILHKKGEEGDFIVKRVRSYKR